MLQRQTGSCTHDVPRLSLDGLQPNYRTVRSNPINVQSICISDKRVLMLSWTHDGFKQLAESVTKQLVTVVPTAFSLLYCSLE